MVIRMLRCSKCEEVVSHKQGLSPDDVATFVMVHEEESHGGKVEATARSRDGRRVVGTPEQVAELEE